MENTPAQKHPRLLAIVSVPPQKRVVCQQPGCGHGVYAAIRVVEDCRFSLNLQIFSVLANRQIRLEVDTVNGLEMQDRPEECLGLCMRQVEAAFSEDPADP